MILEYGALDHEHEDICEDDCNGRAHRSAGQLKKELTSEMEVVVREDDPEYRDDEVEQVRWHAELSEEVSKESDAFIGRDVGVERCDVGSHEHAVLISEW